MKRPTIYLAPTSNKVAQAHLEETVIDGLPASEVPSTLGFDGDPVHIWGTKEKFAERYPFDPGDIFLFYTGDKTYTQAAVIRDTVIDAAAAEAIWGRDENAATEGDDPWSHILHLFQPIPVEIDGADIADYADYAMEYVLGLQSLNEQGHDAITEKFGSIAAFIDSHAELHSQGRITDQLQRIESPDQTSNPGSPDDRRKNTEAGSQQGETRTGLRESAAWSMRSERLGTTLERAKQIVVRGPPGAVSRAQIRYFAREWLNGAHGPVEERIIDVSLDSSTQYSEFVETTLPSQETNSGVATMDGPFKRIARRADAAKNEATYEGTAPPKWVLILDVEQVSNLYGALHLIDHVLDSDIRQEETTVQLPHSGETLRVPANLYIVVVTTEPMKSLSKRTRSRFRLLDFGPDFDLLSQVYGYEDTEDARVAVRNDADATIEALTPVTLEAYSRAVEQGERPDCILGQDLFVNYGLHERNTAAGRYDQETLCDIWRFNVFQNIQSVGRELGSPFELEPFLSTSDVFSQGEDPVTAVMEVLNAMIKQLTEFADKEPPDAPVQ